MPEFTYHIWPYGQPQPDATPWTSLKAARYGLKHQQEGYNFKARIVKIGPSGFPHNYKVVHSDRRLKPSVTVGKGTTILGRFASIKEAESFLATFEKTDSQDLAAGKYFIDVPEEMQG